MATLYVRNVPDDLHEALRKRAAERSTSISVAAIELIRRALELSPSGVDEFFAEMESGRPVVGRGAPTAAELIRADREAR